MSSLALRFASLFGLGFAAAGCGLVTLTHDEILGPVSPIGRIHDATVGRDFRVTSRGPTADVTAEARLRPYPADLIRRLGSPDSFHALLQGFEAFSAGMSFVVERREASGMPITGDAEPAMGATEQEVLDALGPPEVWIRRTDGSLMAYRRRAARDLAVNAGIPPIAAGLIPVPGVANLAFRYSSRRAEAGGFVFLFDSAGRLVSRSAPEGIR